MSSRKRILLVEDSEADVTLALEALDALASVVAIARDGQEAIDYLAAREAPDVLLLDLKLPKVDGLAVLAHVKRDARLRHLPVVMLTSSAEEADVVRSYELGVNAYVVKPHSFDELRAAFARVGRFWAHLNQPPILAS